MCHETIVLEQTDIQSGAAIARDINPADSIE
jgi:hypothetical protein